MTRAEKVAEAQRLRSEGLIVREIGKRLGAGRSTVQGWLDDPDRLKLKARKHRLGQPCVDCGARTSSGAESAEAEEPRCGVCGPAHRDAGRRRAKEERRREIERRWLQGQTLGEIAEGLGSTTNSVGGEISRMRAQGGYDLPHRYSPDVVSRMTEFNRESALRRKVAA